MEDDTTTKTEAEPGDSLTGSGAPEPDAAAPGATAPAPEPKSDDDAVGEPEATADEPVEEHPEPSVVGALVQQDNVSEPGTEITRNANFGDADPAETRHETVEAIHGDDDAADDDGE